MCRRINATARSSSSRISILMALMLLPTVLPQGGGQPGRGGGGGGAFQLSPVQQQQHGDGGGGGMAHINGAGWDDGRAPPYQELLDSVSAQLPEQCSWGDGTKDEIHFRSAGIRLVTIQSSSSTSAPGDSMKALGLVKRSVKEEEHDPRSPAASSALSEAVRQDPRLLAKLVVWGHEASVTSRHPHALVLLSLALRLDSHNADAWELLGVSLQHVGHVQCASLFHGRSLDRDPRRPVARLNLGLIMLHAGDAQEARLHLEKAVDLIAIDSSQPKALLVAALQGLGSALALEGEYSGAQPVLSLCLRLEPRCKECLLTLAAVKTELGDEDGAMSILMRALRSSMPLVLEQETTIAMLLELALALGTVAEWPALGRMRGTLDQAMRLHLSNGHAPAKAVNAVLFLDIAADLDLPVARLLSKRAEEMTLVSFGPPLQHAWGSRRGAAQAFSHGNGGDGRVKVAYVSGDFGQTVMLSFMAHALTQHSRNGGLMFVCISVDGDKHHGSEWRRQVSSGAESFIEAGTKNDQELAELVNEMEVSVLIHLDGHNSGSRLGLFSMKPAPVQIAYRFCASVGADYIPWYIGDKVMSPPEYSQDLFSERLVLLPPSYLVNSFSDRFRAFPSRDILQSGALERRRLSGVPPGAVVFSCFNRAIKIDMRTYKAWMRVLQRVPNSVLWMVKFPPASVPRFLRQALRFGIEEHRVIFTPLAAEEAFLEMAVATDVFLDSPPCNAHTTATYSLWVGTPVLTLPGVRPVSRVASSLLSGAGSNHIYSFRTLSDYVDGAVALGVAKGGSQKLLETVGMDRMRHITSRPSLDLFDDSKWTRGVEAGVRSIWKARQAGVDRAFHVIVASGWKDGGENSFVTEREREGEMHENSSQE